MHVNKKEDSTIYAKNFITCAAHGTGKSFIGQIIVLCCLSQGLNIMSLALMGACANVLDRIYIHKLFMLPIDNITLSCDP